MRLPLCSHNLLAVIRLYNVYFGAASVFTLDLWATPVAQVTIYKHQARKPPEITGANVITAIEKYAIKHVFVNRPCSVECLWQQCCELVSLPSAGFVTLKSSFLSSYSTPLSSAHSLDIYGLLLFLAILGRKHFAASWNERLLCIRCNGHVLLPAKWTSQVIRLVISDWRENSWNHERNLMVSIPAPKQRVRGLSAKGLKLLFY